MEELFDYENDAVSNEKAANLLASGVDNDIKSVMATPTGRKFIARLLYDICDIDGRQFTGNSQTYFNLGKRDVGRLLYDMLQMVAFEDFILMSRELRDGFKVKEEVNNG